MFLFHLMINWLINSEDQLCPDRFNTSGFVAFDTKFKRFRVRFHPVVWFHFPTVSSLLIRMTTVVIMGQNRCSHDCIFKYFWSGGSLLIIYSEINIGIQCLYPKGHDFRRHRQHFCSLQIQHTRLDVLTFCNVWFHLSRISFIEQVMNTSCFLQTWWL